MNEPTTPIPSGPAIVRFLVANGVPAECSQNWARKIILGNDVLVEVNTENVQKWNHTGKYRKVVVRIVGDQGVEYDKIRRAVQLHDGWKVPAVLDDSAEIDPILGKKLLAKVAEVSEVHLQSQKLRVERDCRAQEASEARKRVRLLVEHAGATPHVLFDAYHNQATVSLSKVRPEALPALLVRISQLVVEATKP